jgi:hypothetical protein
MKRSTYLFFKTVFVGTDLATVPANRAGFFLLLLVQRFGWERDDEGSSLLFVVVIVDKNCFRLRFSKFMNERGAEQK